jgi:hypothetical protein
MPVRDEVSEPLNSLADVLQGLAAKNQTMKDGPPSGSEGNGGTTTMLPPPTEEENGGAYEQYKKDISDAFDRRTRRDGSVDKTGLALDVGQAIVDLGARVGPDVLKLLGGLLKKE